MKDKYTIQIFWSDEDEAYIAVCRDFPGLSAFGDTREEALEEAETTLELMIETYKGKNIPLPQPEPVLLETV